MATSLSAAQLETLAAVAKRHPALSLLVLFGSRARGEARETSDWDFGYIGGRSFDPDAMLAQLVEALEAERIDLVDLERAGGQLRFRAACDGAALFEAAPGAFERFCVEAAAFWCDIEPIVRKAYEDLLAEVGP